MQEASGPKKSMLPRDALDFVLYCIAFMQSMHDSSGRPMVHHSEGNEGQSSRIPIKVALSMAPVIASVLVNNAPPLVKRLNIDPLKMMSRVRDSAKKHAAEGNHSGIDYDEFLDVLVTEFEWVWAQLREYLRSLFIEGDLNSDGVLTLDEFTEILHKVSPSCSENRIHRMFKAALRITAERDDHEDANLGVNSITPEAFVEVSHSFGFLAGDHLRQDVRFL